MVELSRTVRFCINDRNAQSPSGGLPGRHNTFAGWPPMRGLGRYYELHVRCAGEPDPVTGYMINIKHIDRAVREQVLPVLEQAVVQQAASPVAVGTLMQHVMQDLQPTLHDSVTFVQLDLTPYHSVAMERTDTDSVLVRQQFEFAAAHRLHVPQLTDEENRRVFGKCNNPSGHGHNYRLEVVVRAPIAPDGRTMTCEQLDKLVDTAVIEQLDHKNLDIDVPQFAQTNTSVENIAQTIYQMLETPVHDAGVQLEEVSVWETGKTVCTYRGPTTTPTPR